MSPPVDLVTVAQAAAVLRVSESTIYGWRHRRTIAPVKKLADGTLLYSLAELERRRARDGRRKRGGS